MGGSTDTSMEKQENPGRRLTVAQGNVAMATKQKCTATFFPAPRGHHDSQRPPCDLVCAWDIARGDVFSTDI